MLAIALNRRDYREFDQIISVYTEDYGKLDLLARGIKKITSKHAALVEPFALADIVVAHGKEIDHLAKVQVIDYFARIREDLLKSVAARYSVSLVEKLTHARERDEKIFSSLKSWLDFLNRTHSYNSLLVEGYIVTLLHCLGYTPELERCVVCGRKDGLTFFCASGGGVACETCGEEKKKAGEQVFGFGGEDRQTLRLLLSGDWTIVNAVRLEQNAADRIHRVVHEFLQFHSERRIGDLARVIDFAAAA